MSGVLQILGVSLARGALALAAATALAGCGQKGPLLLPSGAAAEGRAPLGQTLLPDSLRSLPATDASTTSVRPAGPASIPAGSSAPSELPPTGTVSPGHTDQ
jgi:predicted small lipoprotein YifL